MEPMSKEPFHRECFYVTGIHASASVCLCPSCLSGCVVSCLFCCLSRAKNRQEETRQTATSKPLCPPVCRPREPAVANECSPSNKRPLQTHFVLAVWCSIPFLVHRLMVFISTRLWPVRLQTDGHNRFLNPKSSYERILMAPPCRLIDFIFLFI
jgi:hypothetical protein